jgi:Tol biopolymer transport system component
MYRFFKKYQFSKTIFSGFDLVRRFYVVGAILLLFSSPKIFAQFYYFGQNKVQYTDFNWLTLRTSHFEIYYYTEMSDLAERAAKIAEDGYCYLENKFDFNIGGRIPLILYSSHLYFEQTNTMPGFVPQGVGGFFEYVKGRVVIPYDGSIYQLKHVIRHELIHVFMTAKIYHELHEHRMPTDREPPLWFEEGLAEFWSTKWDEQAEMVMRDAVLSGYLVPLSQIERIYGTFLMYKEGQNILKFISEKYGDDKILLLMENFWKCSSFEQDMKITIGMDYEEFDKEWVYYLKKKYYPLLESHDMVSKVTRAICTDGFNDSPVFYNAGDGRMYVLYVGNHDGYTNIYEQRLDSTKNLADNSPVVVIKGERTDEFESFQLPSFKMAISKDGVLAFVSKSGETDVLHLYDVQKRTVDDKRLAGINRIGSVSFSPDGKRLVLSCATMEGYYNLYIYNPELDSLTQLTHGYYDDRDPSWSPDGNFIVFSSDRTIFGEEGYYNLFLLNIESGKIKYLTKGREFDFSPSWSPNGKEIAYVSSTGGGQNVFVMYADPSNIFSGVSDSVLSYKVSNFTTAVLNVNFAGSDSAMILSAFEDYGLQIRFLDSVSQRVRTSRTCLSYAIENYDTSWYAGKLGALDRVSITPYVPKYSLDIAESQITTDPVFGTAGGAAMSLSDMLGNEQYYFLLFNTAETQDEILKSFNIAISKISLAHRMNYAYGIFNFAGREYDISDPDVYFYERSFGGYFTLSYPLSRFNRIEATTSMSNTYKELYYGIGERTSLLFSNSVGYVEDNSLWGPTGPIDGHRFLLSFAYTNDVEYNSVSYYTIMFDYRRYFRLSRSITFATREAFFFNQGSLARRFFMGGSWDLRGWPFWSIRGKKLWIASQELRFPLIDKLNIVFPFGGMLFTAIRGAAYFDSGAAWDDEYTGTLGDVGLGLRFNLGGVLVLRYDVGKTIQDKFKKLQPGLFYQFFFGWDF